jgi:hypothetical protein
MIVHDLVKHRDEREVFAISFAAEMAAGEEITAGAVQVFAGGVEVTDEFRAGEPAITLEATEVHAWLKAAAAGEQARRAVHKLYCRVTTTTGRVLVATDAAGNLPELHIAS